MYSDTDLPSLSEAGRKSRFTRFKAVNWTTSEIPGSVSLNGKPPLYLRYRTKQCIANFAGSKIKYNTESSYDIFGKVLMPFCLFSVTGDGEFTGIYT